MRRKKDPIVTSAQRKRQLIIKLLKKDHLSVTQLAEHLDTTTSTVYRYLQSLELDDVCLEKDFQDCYYIVPAVVPVDNGLTDEEWKHIKKLIRATPRSALRDALLKKLVPVADLKTTPNLLLQTHLGGFIDQLEKGMRTRHQVVLINYHSANSNKVSDRLVEPIHFGDNYQTIVALDTHDKKCKHFKLDRIGEVDIKRTRFKHEQHHAKMTTDAFGYTGQMIDTITLKLSLRAWLLLREEFPLAIPNITKVHDHYIFNGPVANYDGIARFVLGLLTEVNILEPLAFKTYVQSKIKASVL